MLRIVKNYIFGIEGVRAELLKSAVGSFGIRSLNAMLGLGLSIVLARELGPEGYGVYAFVFSLMVLLAVPVQMGLPTLVMREVARYHSSERWALLRGLLLRSNQAILLLSVLLSLIVGGVILWRYEGQDQVLLVTGAWALLLLPVTALTLLSGAVLLGLRRVVLGQIAEMLLRPGFFLLLLGAALLTGGLTPSQAMSLHFAAACMAFIVGVLILLRALPPEVGRIRPKYDTLVWFRSAISFGLLAGFDKINNQIGMVMLGLLATKEEVGQYRVAVSVGALVVFGLTITAAVLAPHIARLHSAGDKERLQRMLTWSTRGVLLMALPLAILFIIFGNPILGVVFGEPYREASTALAIISVGQCVNASMGPVGLILSMTGHEIETLKGVSAATVLNIILATFLIPFFGVEGAATAMGISIIAWNLILYRAVWQRVGLQSTAFLIPFRREQP